MQQFMTLFDQYPSSWQAAYTAFDVAARFSARLIGCFIVEDLGPDRATELMREFETGARAARIEHESLLLSEWSDLYKVSDMPINGLFIGKPFPAGWLNNSKIIQQMVQDFPFPVWIVPQKRRIGQIVVLIEDGTRGGGALQFGQFLERRWNQALRYLTVSQHPGSRSNPTTTSVLSPPYDVDHLILTLSAEQADLVLIGKPGGQLPVWDICCKAGCLTVVCPLEA